MNREMGLSFVSGLLFALGLGISGMTDTKNVIGFLDITRDWNPMLLFVIGSAVGVHTLVYHLTKSRKTPLYAAKWHFPKAKQVTPQLILGACIFGIGWGLIGFCPGPALVSIVALHLQTLVFGASLVAGMLAFILINGFFKRQKRT